MRAARVVVEVAWVAPPQLWYEYREWVKLTLFTRDVWPRYDTTAAKIMHYMLGTELAEHKAKYLYDQCVQVYSPTESSTYRKQHKDTY